jgi:hypothetical protein
MSSLRTQLLFSHLALVGLMVVIMATSVGAFYVLGRGIDRVIGLNYQSVVAARAMKLALERENDAAMLVLANEHQRAHELDRDYWPMFLSGYDKESHSISEPGEQEMVDDLKVRQVELRTLLDGLLRADPPLETEAAKAHYFRKLYPQLDALRNLVQSVLELNESGILLAKDRAHRVARLAAWVSMGLTAASFVLAIGFALYMVRVALSPLCTLASQAGQVGEEEVDIRLPKPRRDEIG